MAVKPGRAFGMPYLTFLHTSFAILFCQKKVKKNCKYVVRVSNENTDIGRKEKHEKHTHIMQKYKTEQNVHDIQTPLFLIFRNLCATFILPILIGRGRIFYSNKKIKRRGRSTISFISRHKQCAAFPQKAGCNNDTRTANHHGYGICKNKKGTA